DRWGRENLQADCTRRSPGATPSDAGSIPATSTPWRRVPPGTRRFSLLRGGFAGGSHLAAHGLRSSQTCPDGALHMPRECGGGLGARPVHAPVHRLLVCGCSEGGAAALGGAGGLGVPLRAPVHHVYLARFCRPRPEESHQLLGERRMLRAGARTGVRHAGSKPEQCCRGALGTTVVVQLAERAEVAHRRPRQTLGTP